MKPDIEIQSHEDWVRLRKKKVSIIVDPMIIRSADLLLQGRSGLQKKDSTGDPSDPNKVWMALSQNIDSIEAFFDAFILSERLPLVDYGITFDSNVGFEPGSLYRRINEIADEKLLINVHVLGTASTTATQAVRATLKARPPVEDALVSAVAQELSAYDHQWRPDVGDLGQLSHDQLLLARFQYGLLLFGDFAKSARVGHLIQTKRARLFRAGSLGSRTPSYEFDQELRQRLKKIVESEEKRLGVELDLEACPSFLTYLLSKQPMTTVDLLKEALRLRRSSIISDYREWRKRIVSDWQRWGKINTSTERELRLTVRRVLRELGIDTQQSNYTIGFNFLFLYGEAAVESLMGWVPMMRQGRRHSKLLMQTMRADHEHKELTNALNRLWIETA